MLTSKPTPSPLVLQDPIRSCLGLDIAKAKFDACLLLGARAHHAQFDNSKPGIAALRAWCSKLCASAPLTVLEATGYYGDLAAAELHAAGHRIHLANPRRIKDHARSLGQRNKTDRVDAALIASFGSTRTLPEWLPASPAQQRLRALMRRSADVAAMLQAERNRTESAADPLVSKSLARIVRVLEKEDSALQAQLAAHIHASPELREDFAHLLQIEGIGQRSAAWLCAEVPRHLPNARAAAAWLAVTPRVRQSGSCLRSTAPVGADGNRHLRRVLFMAALSARHRNPRLKPFADRLAAAGKSKMAVLLAVVHKLIKISFAILKNHSPYLPLHSPHLS